MMTVEVTGLKNIRRKLRSMVDAGDLAVQIVLNEIAERMVDRAISYMQKSPATGRTYERFNPRRTHTASRPGAAPRVDTGRLMSGFRIDFAERGSLDASVTNIMPYADELEFGTYKMAARPFFYKSYRSAVRGVAKNLRRTYEGLYE